MLNKRIKWIFGLIGLSLLLSLSNLVFAQVQQSVTIGERFNIDSKILGETRQIIIGKPRSYSEGSAKFPVVVLLDGDDHFHHTTGTANYLAANGFIPEVLIVAIPNTDRTRDLTPRSDVPSDLAQMPTHGGADNFLKFISDELLPWVGKEYRTQDYKILIGHSFGGLFAINSLTTRPDVFDAYIAISPSLQWNNQGLVVQAEAFVDSHNSLNKDLYITAGNEGGRLVGGIQKLTGILTEKSPQGLRWQFNLMESETHGSVPLRSTLQGLEMIYSDWRLVDPLQTYNSGGMDAVVGFYQRSSKKYGVKREIPPQILFELSHRLLQTGRPAEAGEVMTFDSNIFPAPAELLNQAALALRDAGDKKQAIIYFTKALQENPSSKTASDNLNELGVNTKNLIKPVDLSEKVLARYVGRFEIPQVAVINLELKAGKLVRAMEGNPDTEMIPLSQTKFYRESDDVQYIFHLDDEGEANSVTIRQGGQQFLARRVK